LSGGVNIQAMRLHSPDKTVPVRFGSDNDSRIAGLEGNGNKTSQGV
jgi:hypothetical protein